MAAVAGYCLAEFWGPWHVLVVIIFLMFLLYLVRRFRWSEWYHRVHGESGVSSTRQEGFLGFIVPAAFIVSEAVQLWGVAVALVLTREAEIQDDYLFRGEGTRRVTPLVYPILNSLDTPVCALQFFKAKPEPCLNLGVFVPLATLATLVVLALARDLLVAVLQRYTNGCGVRNTEIHRCLRRVGLVPQLVTGPAGVARLRPLRPALRQGLSEGTTACILLLRMMYIAAFRISLRAIGCAAEVVTTEALCGRLGVWPPLAVLSVLISIAELAVLAAVSKGGSANPEHILPRAKRRTSSSPVVSDPFRIAGAAVPSGRWAQAGLLCSVLSTATLEMCGWSVYDGSGTDLRPLAFLCVKLMLLGEIVVHMSARWRTRTPLLSAYAALRATLLVSMCFLADAHGENADLAIEIQAFLGIFTACAVAVWSAVHHLHRRRFRKVRSNGEANGNILSEASAQIARSLSTMSLQIVSSDPREFRSLIDTLTKDEHTCITHAAAIIKRRLLSYKTVVQTNFVTTVSTQWALTVDRGHKDNTGNRGRRVLMSPPSQLSEESGSPSGDSIFSSSLSVHKSMEEILADPPSRRPSIKRQQSDGRNWKSCGAIVSMPPGTTSSSSIRHEAWPLGRSRMSRSSNSIVDAPKIPFRSVNSRSAEHAPKIPFRSVNSSSAEEILRVQGPPTSYFQFGAIFDPSSIQSIGSTSSKEPSSKLRADSADPKTRQHQKGTPLWARKEGLEDLALQQKVVRENARNDSEKSWLTTGSSEQGRQQFHKTEADIISNGVQAVSGPGAETSRKHWVESEGAKSHHLFQKYAEKDTDGNPRKEEDLGTGEDPPNGRPRCSREPMSHPGADDKFDDISSDCSESAMSGARQPGSRSSDVQPSGPQCRMTDSLIMEALSVLTNCHEGEVAGGRDRGSDTEDQNQSEEWKKWRDRKSKRRERQNQKEQKQARREHSMRHRVDSNLSTPVSELSNMSVRSNWSRVSANSLESGVFALPQHFPQRSSQEGAWTFPERNSDEPEQRSWVTPADVSSGSFARAWPAPAAEEQSTERRSWC